MERVSGWDTTKVKKLFSFTIMWLEKDKKYLDNHLVLAKNCGDAQNKTFWYCRGLYRDDRKYRFDVTDSVHCFDESNAYLSVENLKEATSQEVLKATFIPDLSKEEYQRIFNLRPLSYVEKIINLELIEFLPIKHASQHSVSLEEDDKVKFLVKAKKTHQIKDN